MSIESLIEKYPKLFPLGRTLYGSGFEKGWNKIVENMCDDFMSILNQFGYVDDKQTILIEQIKEKFGYLRVFVSEVPENIRELVFSTIDIARVASQYTCEFCGNPGELRKIGWLKVRCDACQLNKNESDKLKWETCKRFNKNGF
jgi:hypothetical protein